MIMGRYGVVRETPSVGVFVAAVGLGTLAPAAADDAPEGFRLLPSFTMFLTFDFRHFPLWILK
jgi:hypothetical protein